MDLKKEVEKVVGQFVVIFRRNIVSNPTICFQLDDAVFSDPQLYFGYAGAKVHNFDKGEEVPLGFFPPYGPTDANNAALGTTDPFRGCPTIELPPVLGLSTDFFQVNLKKKTPNRTWFVFKNDSKHPFPVF